MTEQPFFDHVYSYTRAQAIADGVLIDVSKTAREAGIRYPVAMTAAVWHHYIEPDEQSFQNGQSIEGRLWDALWVFRWAAKNFSGDILFFEVVFLMNGRDLTKVKLKAICGPGDNADPVLTIMLPEED